MDIRDHPDRNPNVNYLRNFYINVKLNALSYLESNLRPTRNSQRSNPTHVLYPEHPRHTNKSIYINALHKR